jgi:uncharacterized membrane protein YbjE (DUF340 family)
MYGKRIPESLTRKNRIFFWLVSVLTVGSSTYIFFVDQNQTLTEVIFTVSAILIIMTSVVMFTALIKMKKTIQSMPHLKKQCNIARMLNHSMAFVFYMTIWIAYTSDAIYTGKNDRNLASWFIMTLAGLVSFFLFFLIIWNLGSSEAPRE